MGREVIMAEGNKNALAYGLCKRYGTGWDTLD